MSDFEQEVLAVLGRLGQGLAELGTRMDGLSARMEGLSGRMGELDARMDGLSVRMEGFSAPMGELDARVDGLSTRVEGLDARMEGLATRAQLESRLLPLEALIRSQPDMNLMMKTVLDSNNRQRHLQRRVDDMQEVITGIRAGLNDMGATIPSTGEMEAIRDELHDVRLRLSEVEARLPPDEIPRAGA